MQFDLKSENSKLLWCNNQIITLKAFYTWLSIFSSINGILHVCSNGVLLSRMIDTGCPRSHDILGKVLDLHLRNIKHFSCWHAVISTRAEIGKTRNCMETRLPQECFH